ncbi:MAG: PrsW family intramembrane metalloprotease [Parcubacteria group bacterium]|nr:PrsW family intramembrane metalloprotease [Parcubacteria group bacterium]
MIFFYIAIALLPSVVWLLFYLREDAHPEPKRMIILTFLAGGLVAPLVIVAEFAANILVSLADYIFNLNFAAESFLFMFFGIALVEEYAKYGAVKIMKRKYARQFDEPTDLMIYMIVAALGFAAVENISFLVPTLAKTFLQGLGQTFLRFSGATLLHALASGIIGYFLALGLYRPKRWAHFFAAGFFIAVPLHWLFNQIIMVSEKNGDPYLFIYEAALLSLMSVGAAIAFKHLRALKIENGDN